jgi:hypothetical protein
MAVHGNIGPILNGLSGYLEPRRNAIGQFGAGLLRGRNWQEGLAQGVAGAQQGSQVDFQRQQIAQQEQQKQAEMEQAAEQQKQAIEMLQRADPALADMVGAGMSQSAAFNELLKRQAAARNVNKPTSAIQNYNFARQNGFTGTFEDWQFGKASAGATNVNIGQSEFGTIPPGFEMFTDPETGARSMQPIPGGPAAIKADDLAAAAVGKQVTIERYGDVVMNDIDRAIERISKNPALTTGLGAQATGGIGGLPANDVSALLDSVKSNVGFDRLQQMRDNSPTGGALGQVSNIELKLLQSAIGSLEQSQSSGQLVQNLKRVREIYDQIVNGPAGARPDGDFTSMSDEDLLKLLGP